MATKSVPVNPSNPADPHLEQAQGTNYPGSHETRPEGGLTTVQLANLRASGVTPNTGASTGSVPTDQPSQPVQHPEVPPTGPAGPALGNPEVPGHEALEQALTTLARAADNAALAVAQQAEKMAAVVEGWAQKLGSGSSKLPPSP